MARIARAGRTLTPPVIAVVVLVAAWVPGAVAAPGPPALEPGTIDLPANVQPAPSAPPSSHEATVTDDTEPTEAILDALRAFTALFALAGCVVAFLVVKSRREHGDPGMRGAPVDRDFMEFG